MSNLKDGFYAYATGTAKKVWEREGRKAVVVEIHDSYKNESQEVVAWGVSEEVSEGDRIKIKGWLSIKEKEGVDGTKYTNVSISRPVVVDLEKPGEFMPAGIDEAPF